MAMIEITKKDYDDIEAKMQKCIDNLQENLNTIRAGRANPHVLDKITVDYYGAPSPLNAVANIQVPEARMITLSPWDPKMLVFSMEDPENIVRIAKGEKLGTIVVKE